METTPLQNTTGLNPDTRARAWKTAKEFEALFASFMVKSMRNTVMDDGLIPESMGEKIYTEMLDTEYARIIADNASLGLAEQIVRQIESLGGDISSLQELRTLGRGYAVDPDLIAGSGAISGASLPERVARWDSQIDEASGRFGVDRNLIAAVIAQESAGNQYAVSRAGAKGLMQLMDSTAQRIGVTRIFHPRDNILGGVKYLSDMLKEFNGNEELALASYNAGPAAVKKYGGIPPYRETREYVQRVLALRETFKNQAVSVAAAPVTQGE